MKLTITNLMNDETETININTPQDLQEFMQSRMLHVDFDSTDLAQNLQQLAEYLSKHHLDATVDTAPASEGEVLQDVVQRLHAKLEAAGAHLEGLQKSDAMDLYDQYRPQLEAVAQIESSGHKFRDHPIVNAGIHKGTKAVSSYGVMPLGVYELATKNKVFASTPTGQEILKAGADDPYANWAHIAEVTRNQQHDNTAAAHLWNYQRERVSKFAKPEHDVDAITAYAHRRGIGAAYSLMQKPDGYQTIMNDPYTVKFLKNVEYGKMPIFTEPSSIVNMFATK